MIALAVIPIILVVVGLLMYVLATNPKVSEIGRIMFFCGLFVLAFALARTVVHVG